MNKTVIATAIASFAGLAVTFVTRYTVLERLRIAKHKKMAEATSKTFNKKSGSAEMK